MSPSNTNSRSDTASRDNEAEQPAPQQADASSTMPDDKRNPGNQRVHGLFNSLKQTTLPYVRKHPHAVLYGFVGFVVAALILIIGFWPTFLLVLGVTLGILIGRYRDGDKKVRAGLKSFLERIS